MGRTRDPLMEAGFEIEAEGYDLVHWTIILIFGDRTATYVSNRGDGLQSHIVFGRKGTTRERVKVTKEEVIRWLLQGLT